MQKIDWPQLPTGGEEKPNTGAACLHLASGLPIPISWKEGSPAEEFITKISMPSIKNIGIILLTLVLGSSALASDPQIICRREVPKKFTIAQPRSIEPIAQEITLYCGSQTITQTASSAPAAPSKERESESTFSWNRLIEAIGKFLGSVAWPLAAVYIAFIFRKEFAALLARLKKGKLGSAEFEFENYVRTVDVEANIPRTPEAENISPSALARANSDPRGAIVSAWIEVEDALFDLVRSLDFSEPESTSRPPKSTVSAIRTVQKAGALDANWIALFHDLRAMRNEAAHSTDFSPSQEAVIKYVQLARELTTAMRTAASLP